MTIILDLMKILVLEKILEYMRYIDEIKGINKAVI